MDPFFAKNVLIYKQNDESQLSWEIGSA